MPSQASGRTQYGCDKDGLLRYDVFINGLCSAPARLLGMERILNTRDSGANGLTVGAARAKGDDRNFDGRVLYPKCKNAVFPPMDFAPENVLRSDCPPKVIHRRRVACTSPSDGRDILPTGATRLK
jgi:microtubule-associated protein-like 5